jgi:TrmH family RNA methyltransferase
MLREAAESDFSFVASYYTENVTDDAGWDALAAKLRKRAPLVQITSTELDAFADTVAAQGIAAVLKQRDTSPESLISNNSGRSLLVVLDAVSDPGNAGSMIRTSDWFGAAGVILGRHSVDLYNPKVVRATMGSLFHLPVAQDADLPVLLSNAAGAGYTIYVADVAGESHFDRIHYENKSLLVFGNEAWGVSDQVKELAQVRLGIRRYGAAESLNVGVACGVVLSAIHRLYDE